MTTPYKRRRPMLIRTAWDNRKLVALAVAVGVMLWFIIANRTDVRVVLPFWLGSFETTSGLAILMGALAGSVVTALALAAFMAIRRRRKASSDPSYEGGPGKSVLDDDLPPPDYAARAEDGFSDTPSRAR